MVVLSGNRIAWTYTADDGTDYRVAAMKAMTDQHNNGDSLQGGSAAAGSVKPKPGWIKMRRTTVSDASGNSRVIPVYEAGAPIMTPGTAINVNCAGVSTAMTSSGHLIPEGPVRASPITKESA